MDDEKRLRELMKVYKNAPMENILTEPEKGEFGGTDFTDPNDRIGSAYAAMDQTMRGFNPQDIPMAPGQELSEPINDIVEGSNTSVQDPSIPSPPSDQELAMRQAQIEANKINKAQMAQEVAKMEEAQAKEGAANFKKDKADAEKAKKELEKAKLQSLQDELKKYKEDARERAKAEDADTKFTNRMLEAGAMANRGLAGQAGHRITGKAPSNIQADAVANFDKDRKAKLEQMMAEYKMSGKGEAGIDLELKKAKLETEKLKQDKTKSDISKIEHTVKAAEEKADKEAEASIREIDGKVEEMKTAKEALKKGGVTGFWDATIGAGIDKVKGNPERATRMLLDKLKVDDALLRIANTKGAISDSEMKLFLAPAPSNFDDEKTWIEWLDNKMKIAEKAKKGLGGKSKAPKKTITSKKYSPSRNKTKLIYSDGSEEIVDGKQ